MELTIEKIGVEGTDRYPFLIAGPCSAESEEQVMSTGRQLAAQGIRIFRAGVWKPRTKPGGFEGHGTIALPWLQRLKEETGMKVTVEVATPKHVEAALEAGVDILWIGARTTANPFAMQELADSLRGVDIPVLLKNPVNPDIELWVGAIQRINRAGVKRIGAIHRGFSSVGQKMYRNMPLWHLPIELHRRYPNLPILCDPSHIGGRRDLIAPLCQQAMDMGFNGLMVECHCCPDEAWSDAKQQITPDKLKDVLSTLILRKDVEATEFLASFRKQIDEMDDQLMDMLAKRMQVSRDIAQYKKEQNMRVVQTTRYTEILDKRAAQGILCGMNPDFIRHIYEAIHEESVRLQTEIINRQEDGNCNR